MQGFTYRLQLTQLVGIHQNLPNKKQTQQLAFLIESTQFVELLFRTQQYPQYQCAD